MAKFVICCSRDWCLKGNHLPIVPSAYNLCKQLGPSSGSTKHQVLSGSKLFDTLIVFLKEFFEKVDFEKISRPQKNSKN